MNHFVRNVNVEDLAKLTWKIAESLELGLIERGRYGAVNPELASFILNRPSVGGNVDVGSWLWFVAWYGRWPESSLIPRRMQDERFALVLRTKYSKLKVAR